MNFCKRCGSKNPDTATSCASCGAPLAGAVPPPPPPPPPPGPAPAPEAKRPSPTPSPSPRPAPQSGPVKFCVRCGAKNPAASATCASCGSPLPGAAATPPPPPPPPPPHSAPRPGASAPPPRPAPHSAPASDRHGALDGIGSYLGGGRTGDLNWKALFSDVFKRHSFDDISRLFAVGTPETTPDPDTVGHDWPRPWLYSRVFLAFAIMFILLLIGSNIFIDMPYGLLGVGAFAVPLTTLVLFMELNVWRNISFPKVLAFFGIGGVASLLAIYPFHTIFRGQDLGIWDGVTAAFTEEPSKAVIVFLLMRYMLKTPHRLLNGLLVGACVGAGFAAFESFGYAFHGKGLDNALEITYLRAFFAPGGHVAWAAIHGAGFSIVARETTLTWGAFVNPKYFRLGLIPVACHFCWNSPWDHWIGDGFLVIHALLLLFVWTIVMFLVNRGLKEVGRGAHSRIVA